MSKVITGVSVVVAVVALAVAVFALTSGGSDEPAPAKADRAAYTVAYVDELLRRYEDDGLDATIAYYNSQESVDGPWYGIIIDENGYTVGHPREEIRGRDPNLRVDATGYFYGDDLLGVDEDGGWVDYVFLNVATGTQQMKHTWAVKRDGLIFASGWYERYIAAPLSKSDPAVYTIAYVDEVLRRYEEDGLDATVAYYSSQESVDGPWYGFIIDENGYTIGHPREEIRGRDPNLRVDATGYFYGDDLLGVDEDGGWVSYVFLNPATGQEEMKHTWAVKRDGILFGSGWYERYIGAPLGKSDPAAFTVAFVERAIDRYDREGREASFAYFDSEESEDGQWYVSVLEDGRIATHPTESLRGAEVAPLTDLNGYNFGPDLLAATEDGAWVTYVFRNRESGRDERKHSWVVRHDGLLFVSGWYERDY